MRLEACCAFHGAGEPAARRSRSVGAPGGRGVELQARGTQSLVLAFMESCDFHINEGPFSIMEPQKRIKTPKVPTF